jgi:hypothetical protein
MSFLIIAQNCFIFNDVNASLSYGEQNKEQAKGNIFLHVRAENQEKANCAVFSLSSWQIAIFLTLLAHISRDCVMCVPAACLCFTPLSAAESERAQQLIT